MSSSQTNPPCAAAAEGGCLAQAYRACEVEACELRAEDVVPLQVGASFGAGDGDVAERGEEDCRLRYGPTRLLERRHQDCLKLN